MVKDICTKCHTDRLMMKQTSSSLGYAGSTKTQTYIYVKMHIWLFGNKFASQPGGVRFVTFGEVSSTIG